MKSVLLTGASGFIGRHALKPLIKKKYIVHAISSEKPPVMQDKNVIWHHANLHDTQAIENLLNEIRPTHLLHLAWFAKPDEYWTSPLNVQWLMSSIHLLNTFIKMNGKRAVFVGSCAEYDWRYDHCNEFYTPCIPQTLYGKAKYTLHLLSDEIAKQKKLSMAWGRLFFLFGAFEYPQRLVPAAINKLINHQKFQVKNGCQIRDFMYVDDVADALAALLDSDVNGPVNIASGKPISIQELITTLADKLGALEKIEFQENLSSSETNAILSADVTRLLNEVKWQSRYSLDNALDKTITWWKEKN